MNKKLGVFALLIGLFLVSMFLWGRSESSSVGKADLSAFTHGNTVHVYLFYGQGCPHCSKVEPFLAEMNNKYPLQLHRYDIYTNRSCISLFNEYSNVYGLPEERRGVPTVFVFDTYLVGDSSILEGFEAAVDRAFKDTSTADQKVEIPENSATKSATTGFSVLTVTVAALVDSVSPCSIAILVFLIGARILVADQKKRALKVGLSFCLSVFIAYLLFGLGLLTIIQVSGFSSVFSVLVGLMAVLAGIFYLKDVFWLGKGGFKMEVPDSLKPMLVKMLKRVTSPLGAFAMGFLVACFELPCTGGPYLFILGQLANSATRVQAVPLLLYYNFIFILPLVVISLLLYSNFLSIGRARAWGEENKKLLKSAGGLAMIALGLLAIPASQILQAVEVFLGGYRAIALPLLACVSIYLVFSYSRKREVWSRHISWSGVLLVSLLATVGFSASISVNSLIEPLGSPECDGKPEGVLCYDPIDGGDWGHCQSGWCRSNSQCADDMGCPPFTICVKHPGDTLGFCFHECTHQENCSTGMVCDLTYGTCLPSDVDGDWVWDEVDNCRYANSTDQTDTDNDCSLSPYWPMPYEDDPHCGDPCDNDSDNDGVPDHLDNCITIYNPGQEDEDGDAFGDACDNCWYDENPSQQDSDNDCPLSPYWPYPFESDPDCGDACDPPTVSLTVTVYSPLNRTYYSDSVPLTFKSTGASWIAYSLDGQPNVTLTGNTILQGLANGSHSLTVYVEDAYGNSMSSGKIYFTNALGVYDPWETAVVGLGGYPITDLETYDGKLYAASNGKLYTFDGTVWNLVNAPAHIFSLQSHWTKLYVAGSGGKIYSYDGIWIEVFDTGSNYVRVFGNYSNMLYAGTVLDNPPKLYYCSGIPDNSNNWHLDTNFSTVLNFSGPFGSIDSFTVFNSTLYVCSGGTLYSYNGTDWSIPKTYDDVYAFLDMEVYDDKLYLASRDLGSRCPLYQGGSGFCGRIIEYNGTDWTETLDYEYWIYSLETYDGKLYGGTANKIYTYNGTDWSISFESTEGAYYAISLKTYDGKIYAGMGNGYIFADPSSEAEESEAVAIPEFPSFIILPLFMLTMLVAVLIKRRKRVP